MVSAQEIFEKLIEDPDLEIGASQTREEAAQIEANYRARQYSNNVKALALANDNADNSPIKALLNHVTTFKSFIEKTKSFLMKGIEGGKKSQALTQEYYQHLFHSADPEERKFFDDCHPSIKHFLTTIASTMLNTTGHAQEYLEYFMKVSEQGEIDFTEFPHWLPATVGAYVNTVLTDTETVYGKGDHASYSNYSHTSKGRQLAKFFNMITSPSDLSDSDKEQFTKGIIREFSKNNWVPTGSKDLIDVFAEKSQAYTDSQGISSLVSSGKGVSSSSKTQSIVNDAPTEHKKGTSSRVGAAGYHINASKNPKHNYVHNKPMFISHSAFSKVNKKLIPSKDIPATKKHPSFEKALLYNLCDEYGHFNKIGQALVEHAHENNNLTHKKDYVTYGEYNILTPEGLDRILNNANIHGAPQNSHEFVQNLLGEEFDINLGADTLPEGIKDIHQFYEHVTGKPVEAGGPVGFGNNLEEQAKDKNIEIEATDVWDAYKPYAKVGELTSGPLNTLTPEQKEENLNFHAYELNHFENVIGNQAALLNAAIKTGDTNLIKNYTDMLTKTFIDGFITPSPDMKNLLGEDYSAEDLTNFGVLGAYYQKIGAHDYTNSSEPVSELVQSDIGDHHAFAHEIMVSHLMHNFLLPNFSPEYADAVLTSLKNNIMDNSINLEQKLPAPSAYSMLSGLISGINTAHSNAAFNLAGLDSGLDPTIDASEVSQDIKDISVGIESELEDSMGNEIFDRIADLESKGTYGSIEDVHSQITAAARRSNPTGLISNTPYSETLQSFTVPLDANNKPDMDTLHEMIAGMLTPLNDYEAGHPIHQSSLKTLGQILYDGMLEHNMNLDTMINQLYGIHKKDRMLAFHSVINTQLEAYNSGADKYNKGLHASTPVFGLGVNDIESMLDFAGVPYDQAQNYIKNYGNLTDTMNDMSEGLLYATVEDDPLDYIFDTSKLYNMLNLNSDIAFNDLNLDNLDNLKEFAHLNKEEATVSNRLANPPEENYYSSDSELAEEAIETETGTPTTDDAGEAEPPQDGPPTATGPEAEGEDEEPTSAPSVASPPAATDPKHKEKIEKVMAQLFPEGQNTPEAQLYREHLEDNPHKVQSAYETHVINPIAKKANAQNEANQSSELGTIKRDELLQEAKDLGLNEDHLKHLDSLDTSALEAAVKKHKAEQFDKNTVLDQAKKDGMSEEDHEKLKGRNLKEVQAAHKEFNASKKQRLQDAADLPLGENDLAEHAESNGEEKAGKVFATHKLQELAMHRDEFKDILTPEQDAQIKDLMHQCAAHGADMDHIIAEMDKWGDDYGSMDHKKELYEHHRKETEKANNHKEFTAGETEKSKAEIKNGIAQAMGHDTTHDHVNSHTITAIDDHLLKQLHAAKKAGDTDKVNELTQKLKDNGLSDEQINGPEVTTGPPNKEIALRKMAEGYVWHEETRSWILRTTLDELKRQGQGFNASIIHSSHDPYNSGKAFATDEHGNPSDHHFMHVGGKLVKMNSEMPSGDTARPQDIAGKHLHDETKDHHANANKKNIVNLKDYAHGHDHLHDAVLKNNPDAKASFKARMKQSYSEGYQTGQGGMSALKRFLGKSEDEIDDLTLELFLKEYNIDIHKTDEDAIDRLIAEALDNPDEEDEKSYKKSII